MRWSSLILFIILSIPVSIVPGRERIDGDDVNDVTVLVGVVMLGAVLLGVVTIALDIPESVISSVSIKLTFFVSGVVFCRLGCLKIQVKYSCI